MCIRTSIPLDNDKCFLTRNWLLRSVAQSDDLRRQPMVITLTVASQFLDAESGEATSPCGV